MTSFDTAWEQTQGFGCRICNKPQYNDSGLCADCSRMEQQIQESGAYQRRKMPDLDNVIDRLIWEERDRSTTRRGRPTFFDGQPYEIECYGCGKTKTIRAKHHSHRCCGERMQEV
jgi:hypothetical protein